MKVARVVPGFDLVLFGHDHTRHAETITNVAGKQVVCLDPANNAMSVADAEITVTIDEHSCMARNFTSCRTRVWREK